MVAWSQTQCEGEQGFDHLPLVSARDLPPSRSHSWLSSHHEMLRVISLAARRLSMFVCFGVRVARTGRGVRRRTCRALHRCLFCLSTSITNTPQQASDRRCMYCTDDSFMVRAGFFLWWLLRLDQKDIHSQTDRQAGRQRWERGRQESQRGSEDRAHKIALHARQHVCIVSAAVPELQVRIMCNSRLAVAGGCAGAACHLVLSCRYTGQT
mmetsp:Transcript_19834/g.48078  ORF Transcript_19834/g.48078 Transcript_19834/m.48078 type:complete len:210 (+) Transcript_19834:246-875(+)